MDLSMDLSTGIRPRAPVPTAGWRKVWCTGRHPCVVWPAIQGHSVRQKGGAFEMRGLEPLQAEMEIALRDVLLGDTPQP